MTTPTMEDREAVFIERLYFLRVLREDRDALISTINSAVQNLPQSGALLQMYEFVKPEYWTRIQRGRSRSYHALRADLDVQQSARFKAVASFNAFYEDPDTWPEFREDLAPEVRAALDSLVLVAPDAHRIDSEMMKAEQAVADVSYLYQSTTMDTRELHGWYVKVDTGRRSATGWVVGGRGATLHVQEDPLGEVKTFHDATYVARCVAYRVHAAATPERFPDPQKFSRKHTHITLLLPPSIADERKSWFRRVVRDAAPLKALAASLTETYTEWAKEAQPLIKRKADIESFGDSTLLMDRNGYLRYIKGAAEVIAIAEAHFGKEHLRELVIAAHANANGGALTDEELKKLDEAPQWGAASVSETLTNLIFAKVEKIRPEF